MRVRKRQFASNGFDDVGSFGRRTSLPSPVGLSSYENIPPSLHLSLFSIITHPLDIIIVGCEGLRTTFASPAMCPRVHSRAP